MSLPEVVRVGDDFISIVRRPDNHAEPIVKSADDRGEIVGYPDDRAGDPHAHTVHPASHDSLAALTPWHMHGPGEYRARCGQQIATSKRTS